MSQPPLTQHHCYECCLYFDSENSLDVHLQYHKENLLRKSGISSGEESNYNVTASKSPMDRATTLNPSDTGLEKFFPNLNLPENRSSHPNSYIYTDMRPPSVGLGSGSRPNSNVNQNVDRGLVLGSGSEFPQKLSPTVPPSQFHANMHHNSTSRFNTFQHTVFTHRGKSSEDTVTLSQNVMPHLQPSIQCEKCGFNSEHIHIQNTHTHSYSPEHTFGFNNDYMQLPELKNEHLAEILDLDYNKVHVYQSLQGKEGVQSSQLAPGMATWMTTGIQEEHLYQLPQGNKVVRSSQIDSGMAPRITSGIQEESVYQLPQGNEGGGQCSRHDPVMEPWMTTCIQEENVYHPLQHIVSRMQSPDLNVTTTTLKANEMPQHSVTLQNPLAQQITTTQLPIVTTKPDFQSLPIGSSNASLKSHKTIRPRRYICTACNKRFTTDWNLKKHYNTTLHKSGMQSKLKRSGYPCTLCNKRFPFPSLLKRHYNSALHKSGMKSKAEISGYHCTPCNKWFPLPRLLKRHCNSTLHKSQMQSKAEISGYHCTPCNKWFPLPSLLKRHCNSTLHKSQMQSKSEISGYHCTPCNKWFPFPSLLKRHCNSTLHKSEMQSKAELSKYHCTPCNLQFTSFGCLKQHCNSEFHINSVKASGIPDPTSLPIEQPTTSAQEPCTSYETLTR